MLHSTDIQTSNDCSSTTSSTLPRVMSTTSNSDTKDNSSRKKVRRACKACKGRKVKCSGEPPVCQQCLHLNLQCEWPEPSSQNTKRLRTKRGGIITQYRKSAPDTTQLVPKSQFDKEYFRSRLEQYEKYIYPMFPVITRTELSEAIDNIDSDRDDAALVYSLFSVTIGHTKASVGQSSEEAFQLADMALNSRGILKPKREITIKSIITVLSISSSLVASNDIELAWLYLREGATMASILKLHDIEKLKTIESLSERSRRQRMYWMLYIHERFMAIHFYRPVLLSPLGMMPELDPNIPSGVHYGFSQIIKLFRLMDSNFIKAYLGESTEITQKWIEQKQDEILDSQSGLETLSEMQQADLIVTQQWLRMLVWQMAMSRYWLSSGLSEGCMSLLFPVEIAHRLRSLISKCSGRSIEVHGAAILRKLFELSIAIADVITLIPAKSLKESKDRIDDFMWIANFLLKQSSFTDIQKSLLKEKLDKVSSIMPNTPVLRSESPKEVEQDDPWFSLSRSFVPGSNSSSPRELFESTQQPLIPSLNNLSEMSQGLLNELDIYFHTN